MDKKEEESAIHKRFKIIFKVEENKWALPEDMGRYNNNNVLIIILLK